MSIFCRRLGRCGALALLLSPLALGAQQRVDQRRAVTSNASIRISGSFASIRIVGWDRDTLVVTGTVPTGAWIDGNLAETGSPASGVKMYLAGATESQPPSAAVELRVPARARVWAKSSTSTMIVNGVTGGLDLNIIGGSIRVTGNPHELNVESMDGAVTVTGTPEWMRLKTATGDIVVNGGSPDAAISTIGGTVSVVGGRYERGKFETVTGPLVFAGDPAPTASLDFNTHSGTIEIYAPKFQGEIDAATMTGTIENGITNRPAVASRDGRGQEIGIFSGGSGPRYYIRTFKGKILLRSTFPFKKKV
jgi:hypothetical protein